MGLRTMTYKHLSVEVVTVNRTKNAIISIDNRGSIFIITFIALRAIGREIFAKN